MDDKSYNVRVPKRWVRIAMIVGVTALIVAPLTAIATHSFTDVPNSNTFHGDIAAIGDAGVTKGCNPPANTEYCPDDVVTRGQMAAFMNRLGALGPGKTPVANAATAVEADHATTADNAAQLGGEDPTVYETVVAMLQLSAFDGSDLGLSVTSGPFTGPSLDITVPAAGTVLVQSASSWDIGEYTIASWTEVDTATPCDNRFDGDVMPGSFGLNNSNSDASTWGANTVGQGSFEVDGPGTHTIHFCFEGFAVSTGGTDIDYSLTATWIPSGSATLAPASADNTSDTPAEGGASNQ